MSKSQNQFPKMHVFANVSKMRNLWKQNGNLSQCALSHKLTSKPNDVQRNLILIQLSKGSFWSLSSLFLKIATATLMHESVKNKMFMMNIL